MIQEPAYYANIPAPVRYDKTLPPAAKLLYGEITALTTKEGFCWAGNAYFAKLYDVSKDTVSVWINKLDKCGYVRIEIDHKAGNVRRIYLSDKNPIPIEKKQDRYSEKTVDLSRKKPKAIPKNLEHSITSNNTESNTINKQSGADAPTPAPVEEKETLTTVGVSAEPLKAEPAQPRQQEAATKKLVDYEFPADWPADLVAYYRDEWLGFRQHKSRTAKLQPASIQAQINALSKLDYQQARACIDYSLTNGYTGLFFDRFTQTPSGHAANTDIGTPYAGNGNSYSASRNGSGYPAGQNGGDRPFKRKGYITADDLRRDGESERDDPGQSVGRTINLRVE